MANIKDFATALILTAPSPATSGTSLVLASGMGARMPAVPFNAVAHPDGQLPTLDNAERVLVTARSTDTLTITRAQGGTTAQSIAAGWRFSNTIVTDDILNASTVIDELMTGTVNGSNTVFTTGSNFSGIQVYKNGVAMHLTDDFTITGANQITFVTAPATGTKLTASYIIGSQTMINGSNSTILDETPAGTINGSNTTFTTARAYIAGSLQVFINGVKQKRTTHFTETTPASGIFTMGDAPLTGDDIMVNYHYVQSVYGNADTVDGIHASATATANQLYPVTAGLPIQVASVSYNAVVTGTTLFPYDDTIPQNNEGDQYMTITFTPKSATNRLIIEASVQISHTAISNVSAALFQDTTANAIAAGEITEETSGFVRNIPIFCDMVSGTTSAITFKIRAGSSSAGTTTFNGTTGQRRFGGIPTSWIKVTEYAG